MEKDDITIKISLEAYQKIMTYADIVDGEYLAFLVIDDSDSITVKDVILPYQEVTGGSCEFDDTMFSVITTDKNINPETIRGWVHSHNDMSTFWSNTDDDTIKKLGRRMPYVVSIVVNKNHSIKARVDLFKPIRLTLDDVNTEIVFDNDSLREQLAKEVEEKVTVKTYHQGKKCPLTDYSTCKWKDYSRCPYTNTNCPYSSTYSGYYYNRKNDRGFFCPFLDPETVCSAIDCTACVYLERILDKNDCLEFEYHGKKYILHYWDRWRDWL